MRRLASFIAWVFFFLPRGIEIRNYPCSFWPGQKLLNLAISKKRKKKKSGYASYSESNCSSFVGKSSFSQIKSEAFKKKTNNNPKTKYYQ